MTTPELMHAPEGDYLEQFVNERPREPFTMRVIRDEWNLDGDLPVRTIYEYELITTHS